MTTTPATISVNRTDLLPGDVWHIFGGRHLVMAVENDQPGNTPTQRRTLVTIRALTAADGAHAWGLRTWTTGLESSLAAATPCDVERVSA